MNTLSTYIPQLASVSQLQKGYAQLLKQLRESKKPLLVLKKNKLEVIMLMPEIFERMMEKVQKYEEYEATTAISIYKQEKNVKKLKKLKKIADLFD